MSGNQYRLIGAAGTLLLGVAYAGSLYLRPPAVSGPDPNTLRELAERTTAQQRALTPVSLEVPAAVSLPQPVAPPPPPRTQVARKRAARPAPPAPAQTPHPSGGPAPEDTGSPVKNIAVMGVTVRDNVDRAWLVDLETQERAVAAEGEEAFGFTVKDIEGDNVLLTRDEDEYALRLGEKQIPVVEAPEPPPAPTPSTTARAAGASRRNRGGRRSQRRQTASISSSNRNRGSRNRGNWNRGNRSNSGNRNNRRGGGGFNPRALAQRAGQGRNRQNGSSFTAPATTSNPQTARRSGARLVGGQRIPEPSAINNPQTRRRRGSTSGPAFGQAGTGRQRF
jgi:hypothetical protein